MLRPPMLRQAIIALSLLTAGLAVTPMAFAEKAPVYRGLFDDLAVGGYDPVAYFTSGKPTEGRKAFEYKYKNATWRFSTAENLAAFRADPDKYARNTAATAPGPRRKAIPPRAIPRRGSWSTASSI